jgi:hypothetical protein
MTVNNIEEIKTALAALKERQTSTRRSAVRADHRPAPPHPRPDPEKTQAAASAFAEHINAGQRAGTNGEPPINFRVVRP